MSQSKQFTLANHPTGYPVLSGPDATFSLEKKSLPELKSDQVLLKTLYLSNDPAQRGWISGGDPKRMYVPPVEKGEVMRSRNIGQVIESRSSKYQKDDLVLASYGWQDQIVLDESKLERKIEDIPGLSPTQYLGAFGLTGLTAWYGLCDVVRASPDDTVVVSGAAGATGSMVVQIAKHIVGCKRVIGMAGNDQKCRWVESIGADVCLNYKDADFKKKLVEATPDYADIYFDNVGGPILDLMLKRVKRFGRIAACGAIASYNGDDKAGLKNWFEIIMNRLEVRGFIVMDAIAQGKAQGIIGQLIQAFKDRKIKVSKDNETVVDTAFEDIPKTWMILFEGGNTGKLVTKITDASNDSSKD